MPMGRRRSVASSNATASAIIICERTQAPKRSLQTTTQSKARIISRFLFVLCYYFSTFASNQHSYQSKRHNICQI